MRKPLVLVIDDEQKMADFIAKTIEKTGRYETAAAYSAKEGLEALKKNKHLFGSNRVGLILLDIKMPGMDGLEFLDKLRESYSEEQVGVIMLTAYEDEEKWEKATSGYVVAYIKKPIVEERLISTIDRYFSEEKERIKMTLETFEKHIEKMEEFKKGKAA